MEVSIKVFSLSIILLITALIRTTHCDRHMPQNGRSQAFINIIDPTYNLRENTTLIVEYQCFSPTIIVLRITAFTELQEDVKVFETSWSCSGHSTTKLRKKVVMRFPPKLAYKPSYWNKQSIVTKSGYICIWAMEPLKYNKMRNKKFSAALAEAEAQRIYLVKFVLPFERPERPITRCYSWWAELNMQMRPYAPICEYERDVTYEAISYPVALHGYAMGVHRVLKPMHNKHLEKKRLQSITYPRFTVEMWVYIEEYCPHHGSQDRCSILQRLTWDDYFMTPQIHVNSQGQLRISIVSERSYSYREYADITVPRHTWIRLVLQFRKNSWILTLNYGENLEIQKSHSYHLPVNEKAWYNDTDALHIFGGSEMVSTFTGVIGSATIYRGQWRDLSTLPLPSPNHPMFTVFTPEKHSCRLYKDFYDISLYWKARKSGERKIKCVETSCPLSTFLPAKKEQHRCHGYEKPLPRGFHKVKARMKTHGIRMESTLDSVGSQLLDVVIAKVKRDPLGTSIPAVIPLLEASSCYGNHDATFILATILDHGLVVKHDKEKALTLLLKGAKAVHRGCLMAMGNKHILGTDLVPVDVEQGYAYYQYVAENVRTDFDQARNKEVLPQQVRLIDDNAIDEQTDTDGDRYLYYKSQAEQGELFALKEMARLLYWGANGIQRNLQEAAMYYRRAAETADPSSLYDYALLLVKGQGVAMNMPQGVQMLQHAARQGWTPAMNTLGWYAMNHERNYTKAMAYFQEANDLGNSDAAYNIGHMYLYGKVPTIGTDKDKAYVYYKKAADQGQLDAMFWVAMYNMRGHPRSGRDTEMALSWARYVSEKNPVVTHFLAEGLRAYRKQNWEVSLFYYTLAAETGSEVANFNLAYLCEQNFDEISQHLGQECEYTHYNISTLRHKNQVHPYAWVRMGDYYGNSNHSNHDNKMAATLYGNAAVKGSAEAFYSLSQLLGQLSTEDIQSLRPVLKNLNIPEATWESTVTLQMELLDRCQTIEHSDSAFIACAVPLIVLYIQDFWNQYALLFKIFVSVFSCWAAICYILTKTTHNREQEERL